jgi:hypothetical protein
MTYLIMALSCVESGVGTPVDTDVAAGVDSDSLETDADTDPGVGIDAAYFAIHLDPGSVANSGPVPNQDRAEEYFGTLVELVEAADVGGHALTLMFTAQWGAYVSDTGCALPISPLGMGRYEYNSAVVTSCLDLVHAMEANGHEIAMHHHPEGAPAAWDGFANSYSGTGIHLGTMDDLMDFVGPMASIGESGITGATTEEYPSGGGAFRFSGARGPTPYVDETDGGDLVSRPCAWVDDGHGVWRLRMRSFTSQSTRDLALVEIDEAMADYAGSAKASMGFVAHAKNVDEDGMIEYLPLFDALDAYGITLHGLSTVAAGYDWTSEDPNTAIEEVCGPGEAM